MLMGTQAAINRADRIVHTYETRNPDRLASYLGIIVMPRPFTRQKGIYTVIKGNRFIFIKDGLPPVTRAIVLLHEIGHDQLHRKEAMTMGAFQEFNIFDMTDKRMEYEANLFAAQVSLPDKDILEHISMGYDVGEIARAMYSDINLVALKVAELNRRGYTLRPQEHRNDFLKW